MPRPTMSGSMVQGGTGWASTSTQVCGSRGSSSASRCPNVRADASRCVNGAPSPQASVSVAMSEVCRYSSVCTAPSSAHGETRMAGTR